MEKKKQQLEIFGAVKKRNVIINGMGKAERFAQLLLDVQYYERKKINYSFGELLAKYHVAKFPRTILPPLEDERITTERASEIYQSVVAQYKRDMLAKSRTNKQQHVAIVESAPQRENDTLSAIIADMNALADEFIAQANELKAKIQKYNEITTSNNGQHNEK